MTDSALHELIERLWREDSTATARAVMESLGVAPDIAELFLPLLRDECRRLSRAAIRSIEGAEGRPDRPGATVERTALLAQRFYNGSAYVRWGEATVADHQGRIEFQLALRSGIDADIGRHAQAIDAIEAAGVTCLDEIEGEWAA